MTIDQIVRARPKPSKSTREKKPKKGKPDKPKTVPAKTRRKRLVAKLDEITSLYVRARDGRCVQCGSTEHLTNGHLITRAHYALRWDVRPDGNCHGQCWPENSYHERNPHPFTSWYVKTFGAEAYQKLVASDVPRKWSEIELQVKLDEITALYEVLQGRAVYEESPAMYLG